MGNGFSGLGQWGYANYFMKVMSPDDKTDSNTETAHAVLMPANLSPKGWS